MSATAPSRRRYRRTPSSGRFLDVLSLPAPASPDSGEELHEEELFWIGGLAEPPSTAPPQNPRPRRRGAQGTSGILAALPESDAHGRPMLSQKTSSSRMIPAIPKPTVERHVAASAKCHQSAPVNVPVLSKGVRRAPAFDDEESDDGADGEMLPPHEIVARGSEHSPVLSCSVLEGVGRTLKGRDLRQVRNAVWLQTGKDLLIHHAAGWFVGYPAPMELNRATAALFVALVLASIDLSACLVVDGSVTCLDCHSHHDLSGIKVLVKCKGVKKLAMATTEADGSFNTNLPPDSTHTTYPFNCLAKLLGGPNQLYASRKNAVSKIVKAPGNILYTISTPLSFTTTRPSSVKNDKLGGLGDSKTIDLPLPPEWGLAPSSYYVPFFPIIGVP